MRAAVARLGIEHAVVIDEDFALWRDYGNEGWPARYLFDRRLRLYSMHYGEGAYDETEAEICELLGEDDCEPVAPLRPEDEPGAMLAPQTADQEGAWSGSYEAGGVWAVLERTAAAGEPAPVIRANGREIAVEHSGAFALVEHERHTAGELALEIGDGVVCHAVQFTPGADRLRSAHRGGAGQQDLGRHVAEQALEARRAAVVERDHAAGPVRARAARPVAHEVRLEDPAAGVVQRRARGRAPFRRVVAGEHAAAVRVAEDQVRRRKAEPPADLGDAGEPRAAHRGAAELGAHRAEARAVDGGDRQAKAVAVRGAAQRPPRGPDPRARSRRRSPSRRRPSAASAPRAARWTGSRRTSAPAAPRSRRASRRRAACRPSAPSPARRAPRASGSCSARRGSGRASRRRRRAATRRGRRPRRSPAPASPRAAWRSTTRTAARSAARAPAARAPRAGRASPASRRRSRGRGCRRGSRPRPRARARRRSRASPARRRRARRAPARGAARACRRAGRAGRRRPGARTGRRAPRAGAARRRPCARRGAGRR